MHMRVCVCVGDLPVRSLPSVGNVLHVTLSTKLRANNLSVRDSHQPKMPFDDPALSKGHRRPSLSLSNHWSADVQGSLNSVALGFCQNVIKNQKSFVLLVYLFLPTYLLLSHFTSPAIYCD